MEDSAQYPIAQVLETFDTTGVQFCSRHLPNQTQPLAEEICEASGSTPGSG